MKKQTLISIILLPCEVKSQGERSMMFPLLKSQMLSAPRILIFISLHSFMHFFLLHLTFTAPPHVALHPVNMYCVHIWKNTRKKKKQPESLRSFEVVDNWIVRIPGFPVPCFSLQEAILGCLFLLLLSIFPTEYTSVDLKRGFMTSQAFIPNHSSSTLSHRLR